VALQGDRLQTRLLDLRSGLDALALVISHAAEFGTPSRDPRRGAAGTVAAAHRSHAAAQLRYDDRYLILSQTSVLVTRVWFFTESVNLLPSSDRLKYRT